MAVVCRAFGSFDAACCLFIESWRWGVSRRMRNAPRAIIEPHFPRCNLHTLLGPLVSWAAAGFGAKAFAPSSFPALLNHLFHRMPYLFSCLLAAAKLTAITAATTTTHAQRRSKTAGDRTRPTQPVREAKCSSTLAQALYPGASRRQEISSAVCQELSSPAARARGRRQSRGSSGTPLWHVKRGVCSDLLSCIKVCLPE